MVDKILPDTSSQASGGQAPPSDDSLKPRIRTMRDDLARIRTKAREELEIPRTAEGDIDLVTVAEESAPPPPPPPEVIGTNDEHLELPIPPMDEEPLPQPQEVSTEEPSGPPDIYEALGHPSLSPSPLSTPSPPPAAGEPSKPSPSPQGLTPEDIDLLGELAKSPLKERKPSEEPLTPPPPPSPPPSPQPPSSPSPPLSMEREVPPPPPVSLQPSLKREAPVEISQPLGEPPSIPESPLKPEELLALEEEVAAEEAKRRFPKIRIPKPLILALLALLLLGGGVGAYVFFSKSKKAQEGSPEPSLVPTQTPIFPETLIPIASSVTISEESQEAIRVALREYLMGTPQQALVGISLETTSGGERHPLAFNEMLGAIDLSLPQNVQAALDTSRFLLFSYGDPDAARIRLGLAVAVRDGNALAEAMRAWEPTIPQDVKGLLSSLGTFSPSRSEAFHVTERRGLMNHFMNFSEPILSFDYAIDSSRNLFLIATSRATMYAAIDALP